MPLNITPPPGGSAGTPYASTPAAVGSSGKAGSSSDYARGDHVHAGVATLAQSGKAALTGAVTLSAGTNVTLTQSGQDISIAASNDADSLRGVTISATAPTSGQVLTATSGTGAEWATASATAISGVTVSGTPVAGQALIATSGSAASWSAEKLGGRAVSVAAPSDGQGLKWNNGASQWEPAAINAAAVTGLTVSGTAVDGMILTAASGVAASWRTPALLYSAADLVASKSAAAVGAVDITAGFQFEVTDDYYCDGVRFRWAASSGTPTCTVELWDDVGAVLKTATQVVSTTPTTYTVTFGTPQDLSSYKGKILTVSVWQQTGGEYYSVVGVCYVPNTATLIGGGVYSRGNVYCSTGHGYQDTQTTAETYGVDPILRRK